MALWLHLSRRKYVHLIYFLFHSIWNILNYLLFFNILGVIDRSKKTVFRLAKKIPYIAEKINKELEKIDKDFKDDVAKRNKGLPYIVELPTKGKSDQEILGLVDTYLKSGK